MFSGRVPYKLLASLSFLLFLTYCSVEKNTGTTRFYNGLTAKYNIYFNGYESFKAGVARINEGYLDDFSEILRVFENSDPETVSLCAADMERAIQKASKLISLKSITARPDFNSKRDLSENEKALLEQKEFNEWVDDSYFLIGKARFYKHEFGDAASVFSYCINEANDEEIRTESSIWLARINSEKGSFIEANRLLNEIKISSSYPRSLKAFYYTALTDMYIKQEMYREAIDPLTVSLELVSGKRTKYRLTYLLAQLYKRTGDSKKASSLFRKVVQMNPPYDVEFNARINIADVFDINSGNPLEIKKELEKMLKDSKNKDFLDQIYYALGNLMKKEGKEAESLDYYIKSASSSTVNLNQKGKSFLALAEYYYSKPEYMKAGYYYDSTVYFLDEKYPDYNELMTKSQNLNSLVGHLNIILTEDSLQRVAAMPASERSALISGIISEITKLENEGKTTDYTDRSNLGQYYENERRFQDNIAQEGKWYFYNQAALSFGRTEFKRRWGSRRFEDNWRRSNRARINVQQIAGGQEENGGKQSDSSAVLEDYKKPEYYLKNLPLNDSLLALSNEKISTAYFNAGLVFADKISDRKKAEEAYETLLTRFPDSDLAPEALYELYKLYKDSDKQKSEIVRQRLLGKYPESEYAKIISDPEYYNKKLAHIRKSEMQYEAAYNFYTLENFKESIAACDRAINENPEDDLAPKFMLLRAYAVARISDERRFKEELNKLVKAWPATEEGKKAAELTAYLNQKIPELKIEEDKVIASELYVADTTELYSFVIIITDPAFNLNQASFDIISYNIDNYTNRNYRTEGILVDNKYVKITVSGFTDNIQAWTYFNSFDAEKIIRNSSGAQLMTFLINSSNSKKLDEDKNPDRYNYFFEENYLTRQKNR